MDNMKVISVRLTEPEIEALDKEARKYYYYKRSDIIRAAVQFFDRYATDGLKHHILAGYGNRWRGYEFTIEKSDLMQNPKRDQK